MRSILSHAIGLAIVTISVLSTALRAQEVDSLLLRPILVEAESGEIGSEFNELFEDLGELVYLTITTNFNETSGTAAYPGENRTVSYQVTFPDSGRYELYARLRVGSDTFDDDSFFYGNGFGEKDPANADDWTLINNLASAGYSDPDAYLSEAGTEGSEIWKWFNLSENQLTGETPITFVVGPDSLTRTFQFGAREDGLDLDKFAFAPADLYYTVSNLDNGEAGVLVLPGDTVPEPLGPPLADGLDKWLGAIYSPSQTEFHDRYWNQVTPENEGKWASVEGSARDTMNWAGLDAAHELADTNGVPFRHHTLVWGSQQPGWITSLTPAEQLEEVEEWFQAVADRYPEIEYLEVVNEPLHQPPPYAGALGGNGDTGWDWVITAFEMARSIFPEGTKLMINDYGILGSLSEATTYRNLIGLLQERNLIDGIGVQGHAFSTRPGFPGQAVLDLLGETGLPIQVTEFDVDGNPNLDANITDEQSDQNQLLDMQRIFPVLFEHEAVEGITFWGWRPGLWRQDQDAFLVRDNGLERPALVWLREYLDQFRVLSAEPDDEVPKSVRLMDAYPNPFGRQTQIRFTVTEPTQLSLTLFDVSGREVQTVFEGLRTPGNHVAVLRSGDLAPGVYFVRLQTERFAETRAVSLVR